MTVVLLLPGMAAAAPVAATRPDAADAAPVAVDAGARSELRAALRKALAEQARLEAPDFAADDQLGTAVAVHGDTAVVGAPFDDIGANAAQGSAYVFVRQGSSWQLQTKMTAFDGAANDLFGRSVAVYGDRVVVGAPLDDVGPNSNQGSAYVFQRDAGGWYFASKITEAGGSASDRFGSSLALAADALAVGVPDDDYAQIFEVDVGSVQVFVPGAGPFDPWTRQRRLVADATFNAAPGAGLGQAVAFSGDTVIAGAPLDAYGGTDDARGSAFVFVRSGTTWTTQAKLLGAASSPDANFGEAVALYGDTAVVGAPADAVGADILLGSAYVFTRSGSTWDAGVRLLPSDPELELRFGSAVALSEDTVVVGARLDDIDANPFQGSAYVFQRSTGGAWPFRQKLLAPDGAAGDRYGAALAMYGRTVVVGAYGDSTGATVAHGSAHVVVADDVTYAFGAAVALSGATAVAGVPLDPSAGLQTGSVYVYERLSTGWSLEARIISRLLDSSGDLFGTSTAIDGDTLLVGAPGAGALNGEGRAFVFVRRGSHWREVETLAVGPTLRRNFGQSVALAGDLAVVGAPGSSTVTSGAFVFRRIAGDWTQVAQLLPTDGALADGFGRSVALHDGVVVVGAPTLAVGADAGRGAVYVFEESMGTWLQTAKVLAPDGQAGDNFGGSLAIEGDTLLVGTPYDDVGGAIDAGSAYVFVRSGGIWGLQRQLTVPLAIQQSDRFGYSVALQSGRAMVGAPGASTGGESYLFLRSGNAWALLSRMAPPVPEASEGFGDSVALSPDFAICGAPNRDLVQGGSVVSNAGTAYIFAPPSTGAIDSQLFAGGVLAFRIFANGFE